MADGTTESLAAVGSGEDFSAETEAQPERRLERKMADTRQMARERCLVAIARNRGEADCGGMEVKVEVVRRPGNLARGQL